MKTSKFALSLGGATFAERALSVLREIAADPVCFVTGANRMTETNKVLPPDVPQIADICPNKAAIGGIHTALAHSSREWTVILACDYPFVTKDLFVRLAEIADSADDDTAAIVPVQADGRIQPLCAFYRAKFCLNAAKKLVESDDVPPARRLAENVKTRFVKFEELANLRGAEFFFTNVNTPEEFLEAQKILRQIGNE